MENVENKLKVVDLTVIFRKIIENKKLYYRILPAVFIVSCIYILGVPRTYSTDAKLAPEMDNSLSGGTLGSIAASFGFDLNNMQTTDAISPLLYPDLMEDNGFVTSLFDIKVISQDGEINTNYYDYLANYQKKTIWFIPFNWIKQLFTEKSTGQRGEFNPYYLSKKDDGICNTVRDNVKIDFDKKTGIILINVEAQDALICKTLTDSIMERLQSYITDYRTNKARNDYKYYKELSDNAKREYEKTRQMYGSMSDANSKVILRSVELKMQEMENDMQLKFNTYTTMTTQLEAAKAKVQERTPAFTIVKGAAVPIKPTGPKRMLFVLGVTFLAFFVISVYSIRAYLFNE